MKIDLKLNEKKPVDEKTEMKEDLDNQAPILESTDDTGIKTGITDAEALHQASIMIGEVDDAHHSGASNLYRRFFGERKTMDWTQIKRICMTQMTLAFVALICIMVVIVMSELNRNFIFYKTAVFVWTMFLMLTAYCGYRSNARNYSHLLAYFIMSIFQTVINSIWLAGMFMTLCYAAVHRTGSSGTYGGIDGAVVQRNQSETIVSSGEMHDGIVAIEVIESLCIFGTIFSGLLGAMTGFRGIGRMMQFLEDIIAANNAETAKY